MKKPFVDSPFASSLEATKSLVFECTMGKGTDVSILVNLEGEGKVEELETTLKELIGEAIEGLRQEAQEQPPIVRRVIALLEGLKMERDKSSLKLKASSKEISLFEIISTFGFMQTTHMGMEAPMEPPMD